MKILLSLIPGLSRVVSNTAPIILLFVFSKTVATEELGLLNYFISLITLIGIFTDFGLPEAIQRFLAHSRDKKFIVPTLILEIGIVLVGAVVIAISDTVMQGEISKGYLGLLFLIIVFSASNVITLVFNGLERHIRTSSYFLGSAISFMAISLGLYFSGALSVVEAFLWGRLISWVIFTILPLVDLGISGYFVWTLNLPRRFITFALNNFVIAFSYALFNQWDSLLVTHYFGAYENGIYKSAVFLGSLPNILAVVLITKLLPEYSRLEAEGKVAEVKQKGMKLTKALLGLAGVATLASIPLAHFGLSIVFNTEVADLGYHLLPLIVLSTLVYVAATPIVAALQSMGDEAAVRNISLVQSIGFVIASLLIAPMAGIGSLPLLLLGFNAYFFLAVAFRLRSQL